MPNPLWAASAVEARAVASLLPYAGNARTHSAEQVAQIASSIIEFGFVAPVLVDERDGIIAGHGRVMAAQQLGFAEVPVIVARGWSEAQKRAYMLADNRAAELSSWDADLLAAELGTLADLGFDVALTGFDPPKIEPPKPPARIEDAPLAASFWIAVEGPLVQQAAALQALKALAALDGVSIASNIKEG